MKYIIALLALISSVAFAQVDKPIVCQTNCLSRSGHGLCILYEQWWNDGGIVSRKSWRCS
jgi:hypothetical protein